MGGRGFIIFLFIFASSTCPSTTEDNRVHFQRSLCLFFLLSVDMGQHVHRERKETYICTIAFFFRIHFSLSPFCCVFLEERKEGRKDKEGRTDGRCGVNYRIMSERNKTTEETREGKTHRKLQSINKKTMKETIARKCIWGCKDGQS